MLLVLTTLNAGCAITPWSVLHRCMKKKDDKATARSALCAAIRVSQDEGSSPWGPLPPTILCSIPGSGPCRPGFSQPAVGGTDWGGPGRQYHRLAPHCSYHRLPAGQHTRTVGSLMSHSDTHGTLGCTWKQTQHSFMLVSILLYFLTWGDQLRSFRLLTPCTYPLCKFTHAPPTIRIHTMKEVNNRKLQ